MKGRVFSGWYAVMHGVSYFEQIIGVRHWLKIIVLKLITFDSELPVLEDSGTLWWFI